jgi:hypothetical protein
VLLLFTVLSIWMWEKATFFGSLEGSFYIKIKRRFNITNWNVNRLYKSFSVLTALTVGYMQLYFSLFFGTFVTLCIKLGTRSCVFRNIIKVPSHSVLCSTHTAFLFYLFLLLRGETVSPWMLYCNWPFNFLLTSVLKFCNIMWGFKAGFTVVMPGFKILS